MGQLAFRCLDSSVELFHNVGKAYESYFAQNADRTVQGILKLTREIQSSTVPNLNPNNKKKCGEVAEWPKAAVC